MKFGAVAVERASGAILAHSLQVAGRKLPKGTVLTPADLADLAQAGFGEVIVARLDADDLDENAAAKALAMALVPDPLGQHIRLSAASTGRVNLYARSPGVVRVDPDQLLQVNSVDPMITVATVPDFHRVDAEGMIATIKIISYGVAEAAMQEACSVAGHSLRVILPVLKTATLIETRVTSDVPSEKGRSAIHGRLDRMKCQLLPRVVVPHRQDDLAAAITAAEGEVILILTGSATSDAQDVAPAALRLAGGQVTRYGMPVDPGNLLFIGEIDGRPVIGLPGCARSPALNGADWVLERILCGMTVSPADIAAMGVGGLLKEIPTRPMPRREATGELKA